MITFYFFFFFFFQAEDGIRDVAVTGVQTCALPIYPGIPGIGARTAARLLTQHGIIEDFPPGVLGDKRDLALLFKDLATLRTDAPLFRDAAELQWRGPTNAFAGWAERLGDTRLLERGRKAPVA